MGLITLNLPAPTKRAELPLGAPYNLGTLASLLTGVRTSSAIEANAGRPQRLHGFESMCLPVPAVKNGEELDDLADFVFGELWRE